MTVQLKFLLILTGLSGIHSITTVKEVSVEAGDSISVPCLYGSAYRNHVKYLCRGYYWHSCSSVVKTNQPNSTKFLISDDRNQRVFTVTIRDLTDQDSDYWCIVETDGGPDVGEYFHLSVTTGVSSLYVDHQFKESNGEKITINCYYRNPEKMKWCRLGSSCATESSGSIDGTRVTIDKRDPNVFTVTMSELKMESSGWYWCAKGKLQMPVYVSVTDQPTTPTLQPVNLTTVFAGNVPTIVQPEQHSSVSADLSSLIIPLSLLFFIVMVALLIWFMLKKHKQTNAASSAMTEAEGKVIHTVKKKEKTPGQISYTENDVDVMYSSVVTMRQKSAPKVEMKRVNEENVTYSTLAYYQHN